MTSDPPLDLEQALAKLDGDRETLRELAAIFLENYAADLAKVQDAIGHRNGQALRLYAHRLKSSVSNFFAARTNAAAAELERIAQDSDFPGVEGAWHRLQDALRELIPELEHLAQTT